MVRKDARDEELDRIVQDLRAQRPQIDPLRLDRIKTSATSRAKRGGRSVVGIRLAVTGLTVGLMAATTGGVVAAGGASQSGGNAATTQYGHGGEQTRVVQINLNIPSNVALKSVTVTLNGKTVVVLTGAEATRDITVTLPCTVGIVTVTAVTSKGQTFSQLLLFGCPK
ncbi:MAG TPA: hypothetical protein VEJ23_00215 [Solirubrobacteraceae bacterium]|nr:hypothetical protein [Solirubrobacteraceae bacterium]